MALYYERIAANAKINLFLRVCGKRQDGYHLLSTLMQSVSLCDYVTVDCSDTANIDGYKPGISLMTNVESIPCDSRNTAYKAARAFLNSLGRQNVSVRIDIQKGIPAQAGMAGGSTDAAAVLNALNRIFPDAASREDILSMAARIGADVPFCLSGGTQLCEGIGNILTPVKPLQGLLLLLIKPIHSIPTPWAFAMYDSLPGIRTCSPDADDAVLHLLNPSVGASPLQRISDSALYLVNDLERVAEHEYPVLSGIREYMLSQGAVSARMSGSGSTVYGIFPDEKTRSSAFENAEVFRREGCFIQMAETI